ncbi:hypothetical protein [Actinoplanes sp. KI2]|uniref:hypothetical protein n=1 Tax=Actinoplanes sp. KI2 TaxID=2983315 RepID=UPI003982F3C4
MIAGNGRKALRRAAECGDGWAAIGISPGQMASGLAALGELAAQQRRPRPGATVVGVRSSAIR